MPEAKWSECCRCENHYSKIDVYTPDIVSHYCKVRGMILEVSRSDRCKRVTLCSNFKEDSSYIEK